MNAFEVRQQLQHWREVARERLRTVLPHAYAAALSSGRLESNLDALMQRCALRLRPLRDPIAIEEVRQQCLEEALMLDRPLEAEASWSWLSDDPRSWRVQLAQRFAAASPELHAASVLDGRLDRNLDRLLTDVHRTLRDPRLPWAAALRRAKVEAASGLAELGSVDPRPALTGNAPDESDAPEAGSREAGGDLLGLVTGPVGGDADVAQILDAGADTGALAEAILLEARAQVACWIGQAWEAIAAGEAATPVLPPLPESFDSAVDMLHARWMLAAALQLDLQSGTDPVTAPGRRVRCLTRAAALDPEMLLGAVRRGITWRRLFALTHEQTAANRGGRSVVLALATPRCWSDVAGSARQYPGARVACVLRDPIDEVEERLSRSPGLGLEQAVAACLDDLQPLLALVPAERVLLLGLDTLRRQPGTAVARIAAHMGIPAWIAADAPALNPAPGATAPARLDDAARAGIAEQFAGLRARLGSSD